MALGYNGNKNLFRSVAVGSEVSLPFFTYMYIQRTCTPTTVELVIKCIEDWLLTFFDGDLYDVFFNGFENVRRILRMLSMIYTERPELEFLDINLTNDSSLFMNSIFAIWKKEG